MALLVNFPATARAVPTVTGSAIPSAAGSVYSVTWNGVDVNTAGSASSAMTIDLTQSANLLYSWNTGSAAKVNIDDARVQMFYFGYAVATRDEGVTNSVAQSNGSIPLSWTPLTVSYLLEGLYKLTASFIATNGTTMFSESFYVRDNAPYGILAILPIVLLLIMVYEVYELARSGRYASVGRKIAAPPSGGGAPPAEKEAGPSSETAPQIPPPDSSAGGSPPAGGGS